jgi:hypothetical protein
MSIHEFLLRVQRFDKPFKNFASLTSAQDASTIWESFEGLLSGVNRKTRLQKFHFTRSQKRAYQIVEAAPKIRHVV